MEKPVDMRFRPIRQCNAAAKAVVVRPSIREGTIFVEQDSAYQAIDQTSDDAQLIFTVYFPDWDVPVDCDTNQELWPFLFVPRGPESTQVLTNGLLEGRIADFPVQGYEGNARINLIASYEPERQDKAPRCGSRWIHDPARNPSGSYALVMTSVHDCQRYEQALALRQKEGTKEIGTGSVPIEASGSAPTTPLDYVLVDGSSCTWPDQSFLQSGHAPECTILANSSVLVSAFKGGEIVETEERESDDQGRIDLGGLSVDVDLYQLKADLNSKRFGAIIQKNELNSSSDVLALGPLVHVRNLTSEVDVEILTRFKDVEPTQVLIIRKNFDQESSEAFLRVQSLGKTNNLSWRYWARMRENIEGEFIFFAGVESEGKWSWTWVPHQETWASGITLNVKLDLRPSRAEAELVRVPTRDEGVVLRELEAGRGESDTVNTDDAESGAERGVSEARVTVTDEIGQLLPGARIAFDGPGAEHASIEDFGNGAYRITISTAELPVSLEVLVRHDRCEPAKTSVGVWTDADTEQKPAEIVLSACKYAIDVLLPANDGTSSYTLRHNGNAVQQNPCRSSIEIPDGYAAYCVSEARFGDILNIEARQAGFKNWADTVQLSADHLKAGQLSITPELEPEPRKFEVAIIEEGTGRQVGDVKVLAGGREVGRSGTNRQFLVESGEASASGVSILVITLPQSHEWGATPSDENTFKLVSADDRTLTYSVNWSALSPDRATTPVLQVEARQVLFPIAGLKIRPLLKVDAQEVPAITCPIVLRHEGEEIDLDYDGRGNFQIPEDSKIQVRPSDRLTVEIQGKTRSASANLELCHPERAELSADRLVKEGSANLEIRLNPILLAYFGRTFAFDNEIGAVSEATRFWDFLIQKVADLHGGRQPRKLTVAELFAVNLHGTNRLLGNVDQTNPAQAIAYRKPVAQIRSGIVADENGVLPIDNVMRHAAERLRAYRLRPPNYGGSALVLYAYDAGAYGEPNICSAIQQKAEDAGLLELGARMIIFAHTNLGQMLDEQTGRKDCDSELAQVGIFVRFFDLKVEMDRSRLTTLKNWWENSLETAIDSLDVSSADREANN